MPRAGQPAFDWDDANHVHIARHGVAPAEAEQIVLGASLPLESDERRGDCCWSSGPGGGAGFEW